jgi:hypothetical protein
MSDILKTCRELSGLSLSNLVDGEGKHERKYSYNLHN